MPILFLLPFMIALALFSGCKNSILLEKTASSTVQPFSLEGGTITYVGNAVLKETNTSVTHAVFAIHGVNRTPQAAFDAVSKAAVAHGEENRTLIVAPYFKPEANASGQDFYWEGNWSEGGDSINGAMSSFKVLDRMIEAVMNDTNYPNLKKITVIGHSAGGQFTQRYAAATTVDRSSDDTAFTARYAFAYIVSNPSSYLYWNSTRPVADAACNAYNTYKYGLDGITNTPYLKDKNTTAMQTYYGKRRVVYLLGTADSDPAHIYLDTSCEAKRQGAHRFERGTNYYTHVKTILPDHNHTLVKVYEGWHASDYIYPTASGRAALFGTLTDTDGDGYDDSADNCPSIANPDQNDSDRNGTGDACGTINADIDSDGIINLKDNCPQTANADQNDTNRDGLGDACSTQGDLTVVRKLGNIYRSEYCIELNVTNGGSAKKSGGEWNVTFPIWGGTLPTQSDDYWSATYTASGVMATAVGTNSLDVNQSRTIGLCLQGYDSDADAIYYPVDNCPHKANTDQNDTDGDGIGDACE